MNGTLAQLLSLISYGNRLITTGELPDDYYPGNIAFKFCNQVNFLHLEPVSEENSTETEAAANPIAWFNLLKQQGCLKLRAYYHPSEGNSNGTPDYKLVGFVGGGGTWLIEAIYAGYSDLWVARWTVTQRDDPQQNIWSVNYGRTYDGTNTINFSPEVLQTRLALAQTLADIEAFASKHQLDNWAGIFSDALQILNSDTPAQGWYEHLLDTSAYQLLALQMMYAAMRANVFGGMGSWNDLGFAGEEDNRTYEELSARLYDQINRALLGGVNSSPQ